MPLGQVVYAFPVAVCFVCGVLANEGAEYCPNCSSELELDLMCPNCDEKLDDPDSCDLCRWESGDDLSEPITGSDHLRSDPTLSPMIQAVLGDAIRIPVVADSMQSVRTSPYQDQSWAAKAKLRKQSRKTPRKPASAAWGSSSSLCFH
jgi:hypothetical protein